MTGSEKRGPDRGAEQAPVAEARVRALRDEMALTAARLEAGPVIRLAEIREQLLARCDAVAAHDLGPEIDAVRGQLDAMFGRLRALADAHPEPVPVSSLGLPADARFLKDMAAYLTHLLGPEGG
jgi:hypothetical protein